MGTAFGRDFMEKSLGFKGKTIKYAKIGMIISIVISAVLAFLSSKLDVSMAIIAQGTSLFFGLCAATFLPAYVATLYSKTFSKAAAISSIVTGAVVSLFLIFFVHKKQASSLQLCNLIFEKPTIVQGTVFEKLAVVDPILIALPISIIVGVAVWKLSKNKSVSTEDLIYNNIKEAN